MNSNPTAIEAAMRAAISKHLLTIEQAADLPTVPAWLREFERLAEFNRKFDADNAAELTLKETLR